MGPEMFWWGGWWIFPALMPIVMLIALFTVLYLVFGRGGFRRSGWDTPDRYAPGGRDAESALEILKKRYAKGELNREEFERMKKEILN